MGDHRAHRILAAALIGGCGCSLVAVRRPPPAPVAPDAPLECTQSRVAPGLDTAGAIVTPVLGLALWGLCSLVSAPMQWGSDPTPNCGAVLLPTLLSTAAYTGSALYGFHVTADCRRLAQERGQAAWAPSAPGDPSAAATGASRWTPGAARPEQPASRIP